MHDVCSGADSSTINSDTMYTQQQITMISNADCMYNRRQENSMNVYHQGSLLFFILANDKQWNSFLILSVPCARV